MWYKLIGGGNDEKKNSPSPAKSIEKSKEATISISTASDNRDTISIRYGLHEFFSNLFLLILILTISYGTRDYTYHQFSFVFTDILATTRFLSLNGKPAQLLGVRSPSQIWEYVNRFLLDFLYQNVTGNTSIILDEIYMIGVPRMRQLRVKPDTCKTASLFDNFYSTCYDYYNENIQDKEPFGLKEDSWKHKESEEFERSTVGQFGTYGGGGYQVSFSKHLDSTRQRLKVLEDNGWIREGTRVVFLDFSLFAHNANLLCTAKLIFEIVPTGGVRSSARLHTTQLFLYHSNKDFFIIACEAIFCLATLHLIVITGMKIKSKGLRKCIVNLLVISSALLVIVAGVNRHVEFVPFQSEVVSRLIFSSDYVNFDFVIQLQSNLAAARTILLGLILIKLFKLSWVLYSVKLVIRAFRIMCAEIATLTCMWIIIMIAFAIFGSLVFGTRVIQFSALLSSVFSLACLHAGGLYFYDEVAIVSPTIGPIFFAAYIMLVIVIFYTAYIALIVFGYSNAYETEDDTNQHYLSDRFCDGFKYMLARMRRFDLVRERELDEKEERNKEDYDALIRIMQKHGFRTLEIDLIFKQYRVNRGDDLNILILDEIYQNIYCRNQLFVESEAHVKLQIELEKVEKMLEQCSQAMLDLMTKTDSLQDKAFTV